MPIVCLCPCCARPYTKDLTFEQLDVDLKKQWDFWLETLPEDNDKEKIKKSLNEMNQLEKWKQHYRENGFIVVFCPCCMIATEQIARAKIAYGRLE